MDIVFVDPQDDEISVWWPAIIVPDEHKRTFRKKLIPKENEYLVCYLEDGSLYDILTSSVVAKKDTKPFDPSLYKDNKDQGIKYAIEYQISGILPTTFDWIRKRKKKEEASDDNSNKSEAENKHNTPRKKEISTLKKGQKPTGAQVSSAKLVEAPPSPTPLMNKKQRWLKMYQESHETV